MAAKQTRLSRKRRSPSPLDEAGLRDLALSYLARFATSSGKLEQYLKRKIRERGVADGEAVLDVEGVVRRMRELGYVDDEAFAQSRTAGLLRKGYGAGRVEQTLRGAGISEELREAVAPDERERRAAALAFAKKRSLGPFGTLNEPGNEPDRKLREKQVAKLIRAGHAFDAAKALVDAMSVAEAEQWADDFEGH